MTSKNIVILCKILNNNVCSIFVVNNDVYKKWRCLENILEIVKIKSCITKYFDEEDELISIKDTEDFINFLNIVTNKKFKNNEILVICYTHELNSKLYKYENVKKLVDLKLQGDNREHFQMHDDYTLEDVSSSSSSSIEMSRSRKFRPLIKRYAAEVKKELNYLSGSEVSDGQTIVKKWQIKNIGLKKWKTNAVKCVLLPSEFSKWIQYEDIKMPVCFADQKVDVEIKMRIVGRWTEEQLNSENVSQCIKLKWLLFMDKLLIENDKNFMDLILTQLNLTLNVKNRSHESVSMDTVTNSLKKQTSESSIEKIDQEFSIVNMSDEYENKNNVKKPAKIKRDDSSEIELELPDCPNSDDFQITDFNRPNSVISADKEDSENKTIVYDNENSLLNLDFKHNSALIVKNESDLIEPHHLKESITEVEGTLLELIHSSNQKVDKVLNEPNERNINIIDNEIPLSEKAKDDILNEEISDVNNINNAEINENKNICITENNINVNTLANNDVIVKLNEDKREVNDFSSNPDITNELINSNNNKDKIPNNNEKDTKEHIDFDGPASNNKLDEENSSIQRNPINFEQSESDLPLLIKNNENRNGSYDYCQPIYNNLHNQQQFHKNITPNYYIHHPYMPGIVPNNINLFRGPNIIPPQIPCVNPSNAYQNSGYYAPIPPYPPVMNYPPMMNYSPIPIQNQSSDKLIRDLAKNGNIHNNINDYQPDTDPIIEEQKQTAIHMKKLHDMGFTDTEKNKRLLKKFQNNFDDVIHELVD